MWFEEVTGFKEHSPENVRDNMTCDGDTITSKVNGRVMKCGTLEILNSTELSKRFEVIYEDVEFTLENMDMVKPPLREVVANVNTLHLDEENSGAFFQVASQFNLLEMVQPSVRPEYGIDRYEHDMTQGPICAIACGAGTMYRNYFVDVNGKQGQTVANQIDCVEGLSGFWGNRKNRLWEMKNGYLLPTLAGLNEINERLDSYSKDILQDVKDEIKIGIQWDTEVIFSENKHTVSQAYCSALPVSYSNIPEHLWEKFARLILKQAYTSTILAGLINIHRTGNKKIYLTMLGGGAFGNNEDWIIDVLEGVITNYKWVLAEMEADLIMVSYMKPNPKLQHLLDKGYYFK